MASFLANRASSRLGICRNATLRSLWNQDAWRLPPARSENQLQLYAYLTTVVPADEDDSYEWELEGKPMLTYATGEVYKLLRGSGVTLPWKDVVFSGSIPRHSFLTWLMVLNRCPTRDRLIAWGLQTDASCLLCSRCPETRDHLMFACDYSFAVWTAIATRCSVTPRRD